MTIGQSRECYVRGPHPAAAAALVDVHGCHGLADFGPQFRWQNGARGLHYVRRWPVYLHYTHTFVSIVRATEDSCNVHTVVQTVAKTVDRFQN